MIAPIETVLLASRRDERHDAVLRVEGAVGDRGAMQRGGFVAGRVAPGVLAASHRKRSTPRRSVFAEGAAEAINLFTSDLSAESIGNITSVDAGNATRFTQKPRQGDSWPRARLIRN